MGEGFWCVTILCPTLSAAVCTTVPGPPFNRSGVLGFDGFRKVFESTSFCLSFFAEKNRAKASAPASFLLCWSAAAASLHSFSAALRLCSIAFRAETARGVMCAELGEDTGFLATNTLSVSRVLVSNARNGSSVSWNMTELRCRVGDRLGGEGRVDI